MLADSAGTVPDRAPVRRWAKVRLWAGYAYLLLAVIFANPILGWMIPGLFLVLLGICFRLIATSTLIKDTELCTSGIYGTTRNPLYFGSALTALGIASITGSLWFLLGFAVVLVPLYARMIFLEESYLSALYPDAYPQYLSSVPRFFPRIGPLFHLRGTLDRARLEKSREITSLGLILAIVILILTLHRSWLLGA